MNPPTDAQIIGASLGHPEDFADLFDRLARPAQGYVIRRAPVGVADDILASTFLTAFERRDRYDPTRDDALPWLLGIATRHLGSSHKSDARSRTPGTRPADRTSTGIDDDAIERFLARDDAQSPHEAITSVIGTLSDADRDVLLLFAWEDLSEAEIADALDISLDMVRSRLNRARRLLRFALRNTGDGEAGLADEIETMRGLRDDFTPAAGELALARARTRLIERIEIERVRPPRSMVRRIVVGVTAAATVAAVAVGLVMLVEDAPRAQTEAVEALTSASENVENLRLPATGPGEYLLQKRVEVTWGSAGGENGQVLTGSDGKPVVWAVERIDEVWIPHDPVDEWVVRQRVHPTQVVSQDASTLAGPTEDRLWKAPSGGFGVLGSHDHPSTYEKRFSSYPREPRELLAYLRSRPPAASGSDGAAFDRISEILRDGTAPRDLRAALYRALTLLPDVSLANDSVDLAGQSGVAIGYPDQGELIFAPDTGACVGERIVNPEFPRVPGLGADKVTHSTAVTTRVVDSAPLDKADRPPYE